MKLSDLAAKAKRDPWVLEDDQGKPLVTVPQPTVDAWWVQLASAETMADVLRIMAGDQYEPLMAALGPLGAPALEHVAQDMREAFGVGNSPA